MFRSAPTAAPAQPIPDQNGEDDKGDENQVTFSTLKIWKFFQILITKTSGVDQWSYFWIQETAVQTLVNAIIFIQSNTE